VISSDNERVRTISKEDIAACLSQRGISNLKVYTPEVHHAMQVEYPFISDLKNAAQSVQIITDAQPVFSDEGAYETADAPLHLHEVQSGRN
jgi:hypothetical protein